MRKLLIAVLVVSICALMVGSAFAAGSSGMTKKNTGCGLGTMAWGNKADDSIISQTFAVTTNATFYSQMFGISSGTSECDQPKNVAYNNRLNEFVVANMDNLAKDIALGRGESLDTLAELLGVPAEQRAEFGRKLQANFAAIYSSEHVVLANVMDNIATVSSR